MLRIAQQLGRAPSKYSRIRFTATPEKGNDALFEPFPNTRR